MTLKSASVRRTVGVGVLAFSDSGLHRTAAWNIRIFGNVSDERTTRVRTNEKAG